MPTGLPTPGIPDVTWDQFRSLVLAGLGIAVIGFSDNMLIARGFPSPPDDDDETTGEGVDPQQELLALGGVQVASRPDERLPRVVVRLAHRPGDRRAARAPSCTRSWPRRSWSSCSSWPVR